MAAEAADAVINVETNGESQNGERPEDAEDPIVSSLESQIERIAEDPEMAGGDGESSWRIPRVPAFIRDRPSRPARNSYDPRVVSIGPYHADNASLAKMKDVKLHYLKHLIERNPSTNSLKMYVGIAKNHVDDARERYVDLKHNHNEDELLNDDDLDDDGREIAMMLRCMFGENDEEVDDEREFVMMLVRDGCFIIEFLAKWFLNERKTQDQFVKTNQSLLWNDLLMVENQIPFALLQSLFRQSHIDGLTANTDGHPVTLVELALVYFAGNRTVAEVGAEMLCDDDKSFHHLLHLYHAFLHPEFSSRLHGRLRLRSFKYHFLHSIFIRLLCFILTPFKCFTPLFKRYRPSAPRDAADRSRMSRDGGSENQAAAPTARLWKKLIMLNLRNPIKRFRHSFSMTFSNPRPWISGIPNACYLRDTGFSFKAKPAASFLEVSHRRNTIMVPELTIEEGTLPHFQNLIAFEQCSAQYGNHVTAFARLMDDLIYSGDDVAVLKECGIIQNRLGDDKSAADLFDNLCKDINLDLKDSELGSLHQHVTAYYTKNHYKFYQLRKKLIPDYFVNAWAIPSMIAAAFILVLAAVQTFYTVYPYYHPQKHN